MNRFTSTRLLLVILVLLFSFFAGCAGHSQVPVTDGEEKPAAVETPAAAETPVQDEPLVETVVVENEPAETSEATAVPTGLTGPWEELDAAVLALPPRSSYANPDQVIADLAALADTEAEKVRAVWTWMTHNIAYDTQAFFSGRYGSLDSSSVLRSGRSVCDGYAGLFVRLAQGLGLDAVKVSGYGKGYGYQAGMRDPGGTNHSWNAVKVDGEWYLFDSTWGAGNVTGRNFVWAYDEFYFATPPEQFIFSHYPEDSVYQFLDDPVDRSLFFRMPDLDGLVFRHHVDAVAFRRAVEEGREIGVPLFYSTDIPVVFREFPLLENLKAGETYRIAFETESSWALVQYGRNKTELFEPTDGVFEITRSWPSGTLTFYLAPLGAKDPYGSRYGGVMEYLVR